MNTLRRAFLTSVTAASVVLLAAWTLPSAPQTAGQDPRSATTHPPVTADGNYSFTDANGNYQNAVEGAVVRAHDALSHANGQNIADLMFNWQVYAVTGTRGGFMGKRDITVTIHVLQ